MSDLTLDALVARPERARELTDRRLSRLLDQCMDAATALLVEYTRRLKARRRTA